jgi:hypothetical protein
MMAAARARPLKGAQRPVPAAGPNPTQIRIATPNASIAKPAVKTVRRLTLPAGMGRSGRSTASMSASKASFRYMPPI